MSLNRQRLHRARHKETAEMNITAFMNLMVILVPFLLITAVFSRLAVLELTLPGEQTEQQQTDDTPPPPPNVIARVDSLILLYPQGGSITLPNVDGDYDLAGLDAELQGVKERNPEQTAITLRFEADAPYDTMIRLMDATRQTVTTDASGQLVRRPLFPTISLGDAPSAEWVPPASPDAADAPAQTEAGGA